MGWLIAIAILLLLGFLPICFSAVYDTHGAFARLYIGPVHISLYPRKPKNSGKKKVNNGEKLGGSFESYETRNKKTESSLSDFFAVGQIILDLLGDFKQKLKIKDLKLHAVLAGGDPCELALKYGRAWATLGNLVPLLEKHFVIKNRELDISCDFLAGTTYVDAKINLCLSLRDMLSLGIYHGMRVLRKYFKIMNKSKAVQ